MSKMIYAIFLVVGTMISSVSGEDRHYRTEGDLSSEEMKDIIKNDLQEKNMRQVPQGKEDFAKKMQSTLNKTFDIAFSFSAKVQNYFSLFESHPVQVDQGEQVHKDLSSVLTNITSYLDENNLSDQYSEAQYNFMTDLIKPFDIAKPRQEKLNRDEEVLIAKNEKINELLEQIERVVEDDDFKLKRKNLRKVLIFESTNTGETVSTDCISDQNDDILKQKFYGSDNPGLTGIQVILQSGKTLTCGTKDQPFKSEITQSESLSNLIVRNLNNNYIYQIEFHEYNGQNKTTGSFYSWSFQNDYQIQTDERLVGYSGSHFKSAHGKNFKTLYMVLEKEEYY